MFNKFVRVHLHYTQRYKQNYNSRRGSRTEIRFVWRVRHSGPCATRLYLFSFWF